jgi:hypothetical protein
LPKDLPPYSTVFFHDQHWRGWGVMDEILAALHADARQQVKKNRTGYAC